MKISELKKILNGINNLFGDCEIGIATSWAGNHIDDYEFLSSEYAIYEPDKLILIPEKEKK